LAYEIHIERRDGSGNRERISLEDWQAAVEAESGVRLVDGNTQSTSPSGETVTIKNNGGDVAILDPSTGAWQRTLYWRKRGRVSFRQTDDFADAGSPTRSAVMRLAQRLGANVVGDEGERYE
jgi:hypothetical protein